MNGKKYCSFAARGNIEDIKGIYVFGDVFTNSVSLMRKLVIIFSLYLISLNFTIQQTMSQHMSCLHLSHQRAAKTHVSLNKYIENLI